MLARRTDLKAVRAIPRDRIFLVQVSDVPALDMDPLSWSRHFRNFPGQGDLPLIDFMAALHATGFDSLLSLEVFNDQFRAGSARTYAANEKLNIAAIGVGGQGAGDIDQLKSQNILALCDVDWRHAAGTFKKFPAARQFKDYRKMLDEIHREIDAVIVATPDHHHAPASLAAIRLGKHVYCEKPLTHSVWEAREVARAARAASLNAGSCAGRVRAAAAVTRSARGSSRRRRPRATASARARRSPAPRRSARASDTRRPGAR